MTASQAFTNSILALGVAGIYWAEDLSIFGLIFTVMGIVWLIESAVLEFYDWQHPKDD